MDVKKIERRMRRGKQNCVVGTVLGDSDNTPKENSGEGRLKDRKFE